MQTQQTLVIHIGDDVIDLLHSPRILGLFLFSNLHSSAATFQFVVHQLGGNVNEEGREKRPLRTGMEAEKKTCERMEREWLQSSFHGGWYNRAIFRAVERRKRATNPQFPPNLCSPHWKNVTLFSLMRGESSFVFTFLFFLSNFDDDDWALAVQRHFAVDLVRPFFFLFFFFTISISRLWDIPNLNWFFITPVRWAAVEPMRHERTNERTNEARNEEKEKWR